MTGLKSTALVGLALASILACYTIALRASGERAAAAAAHRQIIHDIAEMRLLRAELRTRSRLPELQRWNEQVLALAPPRAEQLMASPLMLASYAAPAAAPATIPTVVRDAPAVVAAPMRRASFTPRVAHDLNADAVRASPSTGQTGAGFRRVSLR